MMPPMNKPTETKNSGNITDRPSFKPGFGSAGVVRIPSARLKSNAPNKIRPKPTNIDFNQTSIALLYIASNSPTARCAWSMAQSV